MAGSEGHSDLDGFPTGYSGFFEEAFEGAFRSLSNKSVSELLVILSSSIVA